MVKDKSQQPQMEDILRNMEEAMESANLLSIELAVRAFENEELSRCAGSMDSFKEMADRAICVTEEISRLVRGFSSSPPPKSVYPRGGQIAQ